MGITVVLANEVSCQHCPETLLVEHWRDAAKSGWAVPSDGHLQLCPRCLAAKKRSLFSTAATAQKPADNSLEVKTLREIGSNNFLRQPGVPRTAPSESNEKYHQRIARHALDQRDEPAEPEPAEVSVWEKFGRAVASDSVDRSCSPSELDKLPEEHWCEYYQRSAQDIRDKDDARANPE